MGEMWACPQCHSVNVAKSRRCYSCHEDRTATAADLAAVGAIPTKPGSASSPVGPAARSSQPRQAGTPSTVSVAPPVVLPDPSVIVERGEILPLVQDALARFQRWVDTEPRVVFAAAAALVGAVVLVLIGVAAGTVLGLLLLGVASAIGVGIYRVYGDAIEAEWRARRVKSVVAPPLPTPPPATGASTPSFMWTVLQCPDCAEDIPGEAASCPYCGHRFDAGRIAYCSTCQRQVEASPSGTCLACRSEVSRTAVAAERAVAPSPPPAWPPATLAAPPRQPSWSPAAGKRTYGGAVLLVIAGVVAVVGVFLPWITGYSSYEGSVSLNGLQSLGGTDGSVVIGLGVLIAFLGLVGASDPRRSTPIRLISFGAAVWVGLIAVHDYGVLQSNAANVNLQGYLSYLQGQGTAHASIALGLYVIGLAVILALIGVLVPPPRR